MKILIDTVIPLVQDSEKDKIPTQDQLEGDKSAENKSSDVQTETAKKVSPQPTQINKIYLRTPSADSQEYKRSRAICEIFSGSVQAVFYVSDKKEYLEDKLYISANEFVIGELREILGDDNVVVR